MTFERLAELVAEAFQEAMNTGGFETFKEMRRSYDWDIQDIKDDVRAMISSVSENYKELIFMSDDCSFIQIGYDYMGWGNFRKMIFSHLK